MELSVLSLSIRIYKFYAETSSRLWAGQAGLKADGRSFEKAVYMDVV